MSLDLSGISGIDPTNVTRSAKEYDTAAEAIQAANTDAGSELVVEYTDEMGLTKFAVLNLEPKTAFDPTKLSFDEGLQVRSAVLTEAVKSGPDTLNRMKVLSTGDTDLYHNIDSTLSLARATFTRVRAGATGVANGFNTTGNNTVEMDVVLSNRQQVLSHLESTINRVSAEEVHLGDSITAARAAGNASLAGQMLIQLEHLQAHKDDLITARGIMRADALTSPKDDTHPIPGMKNAEGKAVQVGSWRNTMDKATSLLRQRAVALQEKLAAAAAPAIRRGLEKQIIEVNTAIASVCTRQIDAGQSALMLQGRRLALASIGNSLKTARTDLGSAQTPAKVSEVKATLIREMEIQIKQYKAHATRSGVSNEAVALLESQVQELKLMDTPTAASLLNKLNAQQAQLLKAVTAGARIWDGISPDEGKALVQIDKGVTAVQGDYDEAVARLAQLKAQATMAKNFAQSGYVPLPGGQLDLTAATQWRPGSKGISGYQANATIIARYNIIDKGFTAYLGDPPIAGWTRFAKQACRGAGEQIALLESLMGIRETVLGFDFDPANEVNALREMVALLNDPNVEKMFNAFFGGSSDVAAIRSDFNKDNLVDACVKLKAMVGRISGSLDKLHGAFVQGNTEIAKNIAAAYDVFLKGEAAQDKTPGEDGLTALKAKLTTDKSQVAKGKIYDPQGYLLMAFTKYQSANRLTSRLHGVEPGPNRTLLLNQRKHLIDEGNLLIGCQEQLVILQQASIFGDKDVSWVMSQMSKNASLPLPGGKEYKLLPDGGNWADFATRMGFEAVSPQDFANSLSVEDFRAAKKTNPALPAQTAHGPNTQFYFTQVIVAKGVVIDDPKTKQPYPEGTVLHFRLSAANPPKGTAGEFFLSYSSGPNADSLAPDPPAVRRPYVHVEGNIISGAAYVASMPARGVRKAFNALMD
ncbi:MAG: hypothetical protein H7338_03825 [Candidatus Sericytochromatia bacterium]|nr:hypothetical protein [Candidatus Sericytochromatia bacterium]